MSDCRMRVAIRSVQICVVAAVAAISTVLSAQPSAPAKTANMLVYFGTYTGEKSRGIYVSRLDAASGTLSAPQMAAETPSPSYLAVHPSGTFLYAANEVNTFEGKDTGSVSAFAVDRASGQLKALNQQASAGGGPAHLIVDRTGKTVLVANYGGGSVAALPINANGTLQPASAAIQHRGSSVDPKRQTAPHAHSITTDPGNRFAYAADLGLDKVLIYRFDPERGSLTANEPPFAAVKPGAGPRHFTFHPSGRFAYVINEINLTVTAFTADAQRGTLTELETLPTLPQGQSMQEGFSTADVQIHPSGRFLYGSNRGHNSIVVFAVDQKTGRLTYVENRSTEGSTPRAFGIDPTGTYLLAANQRSDSIVVFRIDRESGRLTPTGHTLEVPSPVCVKFV